jgi:hypothetical protein
MSTSTLAREPQRDKPSVTENIRRRAHELYVQRGSQSGSSGPAVPELLTPRQLPSLESPVQATLAEELVCGTCGNLLPLGYHVRAQWR